MLGLQDIGKGFMTETGYITRTGLTRLRAGIMPMIYPKSELILRIDPVVHSFQIRDKFSGLYETDNSFDLRFILPRNSMIILGAKYASEVYLDKRFGRSSWRVSREHPIYKAAFY